MACSYRHVHIVFFPHPSICRNFQTNNGLSDGGIKQIHLVLKISKIFEGLQRKFVILQFEKDRILQYDDIIEQLRHRSIDTICNLVLFLCPPPLPIPCFEKVDFPAQFYHRGANQGGVALSSLIFVRSLMALVLSVPLYYERNSPYIYKSLQVIDVATSIYVYTD